MLGRTPRVGEERAGPVLREGCLAPGCQLVFFVECSVVVEFVVWYSYPRVVTSAYLASKIFA